MADIKCVINGPINQSSGRTDFMINYAAGIETDEQDNSLTIERSGVGVISGLRVTGTIYANSNYSFSMLTWLPPPRIKPFEALAVE